MSERQPTASPAAEAEAESEPVRKPIEEYSPEAIKEGTRLWEEAGRPEAILWRYVDLVERGGGGSTPPPAGETPPTAPPVNRDVPYVTGTGTVGATLNCTMGNWENMGGEGQVSGTYAYQWKSDGTTDLGTAADYTVADTDVGHGLSCVVTATNSLGSTTAPPSNTVVVS